MKPKLIKLFLSFLFLLVFLPIHVALADTGPKPTMDFQFKQELTGESITITSGVLYECEQSDCGDAAPLEELGPQRFTCEANSCRATAYGFAPYHKIEIEFSDGKTRPSNIFETAGFDSKYTVTVGPDDLLVKAQFNLTTVPSLITIITILVVCACALVGVGLVVGLIIFLMRRSQKI